MPQAIEIEVMTLLPPVTGNELTAAKVPPLVRPIESSAVPSSIMYVSRGVLASNFATIPGLAFAFASAAAGARKALAGARAERFERDITRDALPAVVFRAASANGIAQTATSRIR